MRGFFDVWCVNVVRCDVNVFVDVVCVSVVVLVMMSVMVRIIFVL